MKTLIFTALLSLLLVVPAWADDPPPNPLEDLKQSVQELTRELKTATEDISDLKQRLRTVEDRLGDSYRGVSSFNTVERRLDDLRKDVDELKRRR